jgi:hypothetical protein
VTSEARGERQRDAAGRFIDENLSSGRWPGPIGDRGRAGLLIRPWAREDESDISGAVVAGMSRPLIRSP